MKRVFSLLMLIALLISGCAKSENEIFSPASGTEDMEGVAIDMELNQGYSDSDPFVNARLFCVSEDIDVLEANGSFQMDGGSGLVEIIDRNTEKVLWSKTWSGKTAHDTFSISLPDMQEEKEYVVRFTGTKINYAAVSIVFQSKFVTERERPSKQ